MSGNHEDTNAGRTCGCVGSSINHMCVSLRLCGMVTIYMYEVEETSMLGSNRLVGNSNKDYG